MSGISKWNAPLGTTISEAADGEYVLTPDYDALRAENERLTREQGEGTTSNKYRAELYDEVWQRARDMGFENVTMALSELAALKAVPDVVEVVGVVCVSRFKNRSEMENVEFQQAADIPQGQHDVMTVAQHNAIVAALRQPVADEREAFEARMLRRAPSCNLQRIGDRYACIDMQWKFDVWMDRAALSAHAAGQDVGALVEALEKIAADDYDAPHDAPDWQIKNNLSNAFCRMRWTARHALAAHKTGGGQP